MDKQAQVLLRAATWCSVVSAVIWVVFLLAADGGVLALFGAVAFGLTAVLFHLMETRSRRDAQRDDRATG